MSPIAVGLDLILVALLVTALAVGLRLNGRLKALRQGQLDFVKAVGDLDAAAARAESGLKALKAASEDVHDELLTRIETARGLIARLDGISERTARVAEAVPAAPAPARMEASAMPRFSPAPSPRPSARGLDDDLFETAPGPAQRRTGSRR